MAKPVSTSGPRTKKSSLTRPKPTGGDITSVKDGSKPSTNPFEQGIDEFLSRGKVPSSEDVIQELTRKNTLEKTNSSVHSKTRKVETTKTSELQKENYHKDVRLYISHLESKLKEFGSMDGGNWKSIREQLSSLIETLEEELLPPPLPPPLTASADFKHALSTNKFKEAKKILDSRSNEIDPKEVDINGFTLLHKACQNGTLAFVKQLINLGFDINCKTKNGETPLEIALKSDSNYGMEIAKYLKNHEKLSVSSHTSTRDSETKTEGSTEISKTSDVSPKASESMKPLRLVFSGGGAKGTLYGDAFTKFRGSVANPISDVAGSSAGSLFSFMVACGKSGEEINETLATYEVPKALAEVYTKSDENTSAIHGINRGVFNFLEYGALSKGRATSLMLSKLVHDLLGKSNATFAD